MKPDARLPGKITPACVTGADMDLNPKLKASGIVRQIARKAISDMDGNNKLSTKGD